MLARLGIDVGGGSIKAVITPASNDALPGASATAIHHRGPPYEQPTQARLRETLRATLRDALARLSSPQSSLTVGLCAPGLYDPTQRVITRAVNLPAIVGMPLDDLVRSALPLGSRLESPIAVLSDALAAALDAWAVADPPLGQGRLLALSLGTGVGAAVLDGGRPLRVTGDSAGHLGQADVSLTEHDAPIAPDGGRGGLEAYIGAPALLRAHGPSHADLAAWFDRCTGDEPEFRALARALRVAHAIYRPDAVWIGGGIGRRIARLGPRLADRVNTHLTSLARHGWTLRFAGHDFHAAAGAARAGALPTALQPNTSTSEY